jgi:hypothetical protein
MRREVFSVNESVFASYNFRKRIEKLFLWFLPIFFLSVIYQFFYQKFLKHTVDQALIKGIEVSDHISSAMLFSYGFGFLDNIVVAVWLYFQAKELKYNRVVWTIMGLFDFKAALIAFIGVTIFNTYQETFNE